MCRHHGCEVTANIHGLVKIWPLNQFVHYDMYCWGVTAITNNTPTFSKKYKLQPSASLSAKTEYAQRTRIMWPILGPSGAGRTQMDPMLATWTLLYGWVVFSVFNIWHIHPFLLPFDMQYRRLHRAMYLHWWLPHINTLIEQVDIIFTNKANETIMPNYCHYNGNKLVPLPHHRAPLCYKSHPIILGGDSGRRAISIRHSLRTYLHDFVTIENCVGLGVVSIKMPWLALNCRRYGDVHHSRCLSTEHTTDEIKYACGFVTLYTSSDKAWEWMIAVNIVLSFSCRLKEAYD